MEPFDATTRASAPGAQQAGRIWHNFQSPVSPSVASTDEESGGSDEGSTRSSNNDVLSTQRPGASKAPPPRSSSLTSKKKMKAAIAFIKDEELVCSQDDAPNGIAPELDGEESKVVLQQQRGRRLYGIGVVLAIVTVVAVVVCVTMARSQGSSDATSSDKTVISPPTCDISGVETICRPYYSNIFDADTDDLPVLDTKHIPKCAQDNFIVVFVKSGNPSSYVGASQESLFSCDSKGMALKRLSAMEYEQHTPGMLSCEYTLFDLYYQYGEMQWWTESGAVLTNVCTREEVVCNESGQVESFLPEYWGGPCYLAELDILSDGSI